MEPRIYLVVNVDADPDPVDTPADNDAVLEKYKIVQQLINERCSGKAVISVHSSPLYRERFIQSPFVDFWKEWTSGGGDLVLHMEEDFYALPENRRASSTGFENLEIVEQAMKETVSALSSEGLTCRAYRGGSNSMTPEIAEVLTELGISVDLSCAPGLIWKERAVNWARAPLSGYFMSPQALLGRKVSERSEVANQRSPRRTWQRSRFVRFAPGGMVFLPTSPGHQSSTFPVSNLVLSPPEFKAQGSGDM